jgi:hypothetical protein
MVETTRDSPTSRASHLCDEAAVATFRDGLLAAKVQSRFLGSPLTDSRPKDQDAFIKSAKQHEYPTGQSATGPLFWDHNNDNGRGRL